VYITVMSWLPSSGSAAAVVLTCTKYKQCEVNPHRCQLMSDNTHIPLLIYRRLPAMVTATNSSPPVPIEPKFVSIYSQKSWSIPLI
jgi:hypothetical protein